MNSMSYGGYSLEKIFKRSIKLQNVNKRAKRKRSKSDGEKQQAGFKLPGQHKTCEFLDYDAQFSIRNRSWL